MTGRDDGLVDLGSRIAGVLNAHDPAESARRAADMRQARDEYAGEVIEQARAFPTYPVPELVAARFPGFDPADPSTWPDPDRCTDGRPWGHDAYRFGPGGDEARRWELYLTGRTRPCRNRWRDERYRLCGTHLRPFLTEVERARRRLVTRDREVEHIGLARDLGAYGVVADGRPMGVVLDADNTRALLRLLAEAGNTRTL